MPSVIIQKSVFGGVMISVLTQSRVDRWFMPSSGQIKDYKRSKDFLSLHHDNVS